jgi:hypothetical protein
MCAVTGAFPYQLITTNSKMIAHSINIAPRTVPWRLRGEINRRVQLFWKLEIVVFSFYLLDSIGPNQNLSSGASISLLLPSSKGVFLA